MIIDIVQVMRAAVIETKDYPPIGTHRDRPISLPVTLERVYLASRQVQIGDGGGGVEPCQNAAQLLYMFGLNAARIVVFVTAFQALIVWNRSW